MNVIEGRRDVGQLGTRNKWEGRDWLRSLYDLARKLGGDSEDLAGNEFDGIRSEMDFRRAMALEEERLRGSWSQRALRALGAIGPTLWNSRALRLLR